MGSYGGGLFCVPWGHCRKEIAEAVYQQMLTLDYSSPFQAGQPGAFALMMKGTHVNRCA